MFRLRYLSVFFLLLFFVFCKNPESNLVEETAVSTVEYADGFSITKHANHTLVTIKTPWPNSNKTFRYAFVKNGETFKKPSDVDAVISVPITAVVVTSTTHIPSLEMLNETESLVGFPNLNFISSENVRKRISDKKISDVGQNENLNTEVLIDLAPDVVVGFAMDGTNPTFSVIQKAGIPVLYNADWTETTPLGKAEWIKFFGVLFDKETMANEIFDTIVASYQEAKMLAKTAKSKPSVISGAMYNDVWYTPEGGSWAAKFIEDAHGDYLWKHTKGTGSLSLHIESVLERGHDADFWVGPAQYSDLESLKKANPVYSKFKAYKNGAIYTFSLKKGATGGSIYYELASNRPDLVLKDHIKILHPELLPDYELFFFDKLQ